MSALFFKCRIGIVLLSSSDHNKFPFKSTQFFAYSFNNTLAYWLPQTLTHLSTHSLAQSVSPAHSYIYLVSHIFLYRLSYCPTYCLPEAKTDKENN